MSAFPHERGIEIVIDSQRKGKGYWLEIWNYRELLFFLTWRDILIRYKQTVIGIAWGAIRPLFTIIVFTFVFGRIARLNSMGMPYPLLVCMGILPWQFFSNSLTDASNSLVNNAEILTKVYFPRMIFPISSILISMVDFAISFGILILLMIFYRYVPSWKIIVIPIFLFMGFVTSLGAGLFFSSLNVRFRDFKFIIPFVLQLGLFVSPVGLSSTIFTSKYKWLYYLNPMAGVIDGCRWALSGDSRFLDLQGLGVSIIITIVCLIIGVRYFRHVENEFADII